MRGRWGTCADFIFLEGDFWQEGKQLAGADGGTRLSRGLPRAELIGTGILHCARSDNKSFLLLKNVEFRRFLRVQSAPPDDWGFDCAASLAAAVGEDMLGSWVAALLRARGEGKPWQTASGTKTIQSIAD